MSVSKSSNAQNFGKSTYNWECRNINKKHNNAEEHMQIRSRIKSKSDSEKINVIRSRKDNAIIKNKGR